VAGEPGAVGAGGFHSDHGHRPEGPQPGQQGLVAGCGGGELGVAQAAAAAIQGDGVMGVGVAVDPADDSSIGGGHAGGVASGWLGAARAGTGGHNSDEALDGASSYQVTPPGPAANAATVRAPGPTSPGNDTSRVNLLVGQAQQDAC
jgi:hypothetical protein